MNKEKYITKVGQDFALASELLKKGEVVAIPTETVYGLAANALNESAVLKIFESKKRPSFNPLIIHVSSIEDFHKYAYVNNQFIYDLADRFSPGPITFLLPKKQTVLDVVTSGLPSVAIRIPAQKLTLELLQNIDFPLAAPSANLFGYVSPTNSKHVLDNLGGKIPYILDGGNCSVGVESTIISFINNEPEILRYGGVTLEEIEKVIGKTKTYNNDLAFKPHAPGMLKNHYATVKPLYLGTKEEFFANYNSESTALISFTGNIETRASVFLLSKNGILKEAAANLFSIMRDIDNLRNIERIFAIYLPNEGLGFAINDRLKRASSNN